MRASLVLDGKTYYFLPKGRAPGGVFETRLGGLKVVLEYGEPAEQAFTLRMRLENTGAQNTGRITLPRTLDAELATGGAPALWHSLKGDSCGAESFFPLDKKLSAGTALHAEPLGGRSSNTTGFPYFDLCCGGVSLVCAIGWTGQWSEELSADDGAVRICIGLCDADFFLRPGEAVCLPSVLVCCGGADVARTRRDFRRLCLEKFSPRARLGGSLRLPLAIQPFDRYFQALDGSGKNTEWASEKGQLKTLANAVKCRYFDTFWLDAAWFYEGFPNGVGNFRFAEDFPNGLRKVSDAVHAQGMRMMLWFEPERVYEGSDTFRQHGDMLLSCPAEEHQRLFNLGDGRARDWLTKTLIDFIRANGIDIYRQDFNMDPLPYWRAADEAGRRGITEMRYVEGLYRMWDALTAEFPGLLIDNCSSGGRRIDFETCRRSVPLWRSDTGCFPETKEHRASVWNSNQILGLSEYLPYHAGGVWSFEPYDFRAAETSGAACNFDVLNPDFPFEEAASMLGEMQRCRDCWEGDFYPLTAASTDETLWAGYQLDKGGRGVCFFFRRPECREERRVFRLRALNPEKLYLVRLTGDDKKTAERVCTGRELESISLPIPRPRGSLLLEYAEKETL